MSFVWTKEVQTQLDGLIEYNDFLSDRLSNLFIQQCQLTFATINNPDAEVIKFDHGNNVAFCVGIATESTQKLSVKSDIDDMRTALTEKMNFKHVGVQGTSESVPSLTKEDLRVAFIEYAKKVEDDGNFMFYFSGHGHESQGRCVLVIGDESSGISGDDLVQWLNYAQCKAKNVVFVFDCCYAGNLGNTLTLETNLKINAQLFVMCACAPGEKSTGISVLENSIFTYFLLDYLNTSPECSKEFKIEQAMGTISMLCFRFSSLILLNKKGQICCGNFNPKFFFKGRPNYQCDSSPSNPELNNPTSSTSLLRSLLDSEGARKQPHAKVKSWLQLRFTKESLQILNEKALNCRTLQNAILSALVLSSALLHYTYSTKNKEKKLLEKKNIFLEIAITVLNLEEINFNVTKDHVITSLEGYMYVVRDLSIETSYLNNLWHILKHGSEPEDRRESCCCSII